MPLDQDLTEFSTAAPAIATFQASDSIDGTGIDTYYPTVSIDTSGTTYHLIKDIQPSALRSLKLAGVGNINTNFDLSPFNQPRTITGIATLSIALGAESLKTCNVSAQLQKLDAASVEDNISAVITSANFTGTTTNGELGIQLFMQIPVTTNTLFATGDRLRLNLILTQTNAGDGTEMGCDPSGRISIGTWITSVNFTSTKAQLNVHYLNEQ